MGHDWSSSNLLDLPEDLHEKTTAVAKVFSITRHAANAMIFGQMLPTNEQLDRIAKILDVCPLWLSGRTQLKKTYSNLV